MNLNMRINSKIIFLCFLVASSATLGSLFFSDIMGFNEAFLYRNL